MQERIRTKLLRTLKTTGVFDRVLDSNWRRRRLMILCYHSVALDEENQWRPAQFLTADRLRERFEFLKRGGYSVLDLDEGLKRLYRNDLPARSVVLTFDDGTYDLYKLIYPLLRQYQFPATVYQTTHYCSRKIPVFSFICSYMLWKKRGALLPAAPSMGIGQDTSLSASASREAVVNQMISFAEERKFSSEQKNDLAAELAHALGLDYGELLKRRIAHLMTPEEIAELASAGIKFELHTHRHRTPRDRDLFIREIDDNRNALHEITGAHPSNFCYPSGDYDLVFLPWLAESGVISATTCVPALASTASHPLLLPRFVDTTGQTELDFESWLSGVGAVLYAGANPNRLKGLYPPAPQR
jgi:peptidoglycan/xylan/chitin deacetylase (PgdA/CDA1 family)